MTLFRLVLLVLLLGLARPVAADEFRPAYLELRQLDATTYDVLWKLPAIDEFTTLKVSPQFPANVSALTAKKSTYADGIAVQRWVIHAQGGLKGATITFSNLSLTRIDVLVRISRSDGTVQIERIMPLSPSFVVSASPGPWEVVRTYTLLGVEHILIGLDHLLFVLALLILVGDFKRLLQTITAFTVAHSITLGLATLDIVRVPGPLLEATIALSIVFIAVEIVQQQRGRQGLTTRAPWIVAFGFGLLHGLGFASALQEIGLPQNAIALALLFFNVGVEIGQVIFIGAVLVTIRLARLLIGGRLDPAKATLATAYAIGGLSTFWVFERVASF